MSVTDNLLQATLNRLAARLREKAISTAAKIALITKDAPNQLKNEWEVFKNEVIEEADKLENNSNEVEVPNSSEFSNNPNPQIQIDRLRSKVSKLSKKFEDEKN